MKNRTLNRRSAFQALGMLLMAAAAMAPGLAFAAPDFFTGSIVPGDKSVEQLLKPIFGELFGGAATTGFAKTIQVFNAACMTVGGVLAAYTIVFGTMATAHDGEMLGKKWSSAWVPIRTALGIGLVAPLGSGFCVAQMIIAWISLQGVGLADSLWTTYINNAVSPAGMAPVATMPATRDMATSMLTSLTCMAAGNKISATGQAIHAGATYTASAQPGDKGRQYGTPGEPSVCGGMNYETVDSGVNQALVNVSNLSAMSPVAINSTTEEKLDAQRQLRDAHRAAALVMETRLAPLAAKIASNATTGSTPAVLDVSLIETAAEEYQLSVATTAASLFGGADALQAIKQSATQDGWILAGSWFMRAAQLQDAVNQATTSVPAMIQPSNAPGGEGAAPDFEIYYNTLSASVANSTGRFGLESRMPSTNNNGGVNDHEASQGNWFTKKFNFAALAKEKVFGPAAEAANKAILPNPNRHPMMELKSLGDRLMGVSELIVGGGILVSLASAALGSLLLTLGLTVFAFASMISVYFPVLPFIIYFGTALGWLLLVAESIIAAPLVAVMKLAPGGDDVMGNSRPAYMLILGLLLRPALIVLGFIVSLVAVEFVVRLLNQVFFPLFFASMGASMTGLVTWIVGLGIYFTVMTTVLHKLFGLTHIIPDQILRWIGGGGDGLGNTAGQLGNEAKGTVVAAVGGIRSGAQASQSAAVQSRASASQNEGNRQSAANLASSHKGEIPALDKEARSADAKATGPGATADDKLDAADAHHALAERHALAGDALKKAGPGARGEMEKHYAEASKHAKKAEALRGEAAGMPPPPRNTGDDGSDVG